MNLQTQNVLVTAALMAVTTLLVYVLNHVLLLGIPDLYIPIVSAILNAAIKFVQEAMKKYAPPAAPALSRATGEAPGYWHRVLWG